MPLYYFDIEDRVGVHRDEIGDDFESLEEALTHVQALLPDIARDNPPDSDQHTITCKLRNEAGIVVYQGELIYRGTRLSD